MCGVQEGIKPVASIIHYKQFRDWRRSGVAFEFGDQTYTNPNRTMASYAEVHLYILSIQYKGT